MNKVLFIDIFNCLIKTRSHKKYPLHNLDWVFNDSILNFIKDNEIENVCIISNMSNTLIFNKRKHEELINFVQDRLIQSIKVNTESIYYNNSDKFFDYPNPGGIYNFAIENDVYLNEAIYMTENQTSSLLSSIGKIIHIK